VRGDRAVVRSVIQGDGGDPASTHGAGGRVARWDLEPGAHAFHLDDYGAPAFPGLVLAATRETVQERTTVVKAAIRALQRGYQQAQADPESAATAIPAPGAAAQLDAVAPAFTAGAQGVGQLRMPVLRQWAAWARRYGVLRRPLDVTQAFDLSLAGRPPSAD
jgi:ABC-type nitrate/sulfonate/bicarbonate transport system substrate-binding protein